MLRSATAFWGRRQIERLLMAKQEKQQAGRRDSLRRADGRGDPADRSGYAYLRSSSRTRAKGATLSEIV